jgi:hypothetical protein
MGYMGTLIPALLIHVICKLKGNLSLGTRHVKKEKTSHIGRYMRVYSLCIQDTSKKKLYTDRQTKTKKVKKDKNTTSTLYRQYIFLEEKKRKKHGKHDQHKNEKTQKTENILYIEIRRSVQLFSCEIG